MPLFRREAVDSAREQTQGAVLRIEPIAARLAVWVAAAVAIALIGFAVFGSYTRKARVRGYLVPTRGLIKVHSQDTGIVTESRIVEGQHVAQGDVLFVVSMERASGTAAEGQAAAMSSLEDRRSSLTTEVAQQDRLVALEIQGLERRETALSAELLQLDAEIAAQERQVANAESTYERHETLREMDLVAPQLVLEKEQDLLAQRGRLAALERTRIGLVRERDTLRADIAAARLKGQTLQASLERDISSVTQALTEYEMRRTFLVTAPAGGTATTVLVEQGQTATPTQTLVSIVPDGAELEAHLYVPSSSVGFLELGQDVQLRYDAFPYERFGSHLGRITEISRALVLPGESAVPIALAEPAYRITVALPQQVIEAYASELPLRPGMQLDADIWLERRRIYQWLLDPLYAVAKRT